MPGYHLPYFTAAANGLYAAHGLDVEIVDPEPGPENTRAVARGAYDACLTSVAYFLRAKAADPALPAKFVFMVARRTHMAAFCAGDRPTAAGAIPETLHDLTGATVLGSADSPFVREYLAALRAIGAEPGPLVELPYGEVMNALAEGRGDVAADYLDLLPAFEAAAAPHGARVRALPFYAAGIDVYGSGLVVGSHLLESRRDVVERLVAAVRAALTVTRRRPQIGLPLLESRFPSVDAHRALAGWEAGTPLVFGDDADADELGRMDAETWERTIRHHVDTQAIPPLPVESLFEVVAATAIARSPA
jgi:NitT/TauT family transport system substrate-binding protein